MQCYLKIEAVFKLFLSLYISCTILLSCGIAHPCAFSERVKYCLYLQCFDMFVEQTKEIMYQKWKRALLADLIWTCGQHVLFCNISFYPISCNFARISHFLPRNDSSSKDFTKKRTAIIEKYIFS